MLLYPRSDANSDDDRLQLLADPDLARRLRKANPKFFTRNGHHSIVKMLALAGIVSLVAGYFIEPVVTPPYRQPVAVVTTQVHHVAPIPVRLRAHHSAAPAAPAKPVIAVAPKAAPIAEPQPQLQPQKRVQHRTRTVAAADPQVQERNEQQFWLQAQAEARAKDRMRAKALAATAAAENSAEETAAQAPAKTPIDTGTPAKIVLPQPPVNAPRVPAPVSEPWPGMPGGGSCTPGRGPILVGGHGLGGMIINSVIQSVVPHTRPFGRP